MRAIKLKYKEIRALLEIEPVEYGKYVGPLINLANRFAGGTKPRVVGQMTELIKEFTGRHYTEWEAWYLKKHGSRLEQAREKISDMLKKMSRAFDGITDADIDIFVKDLVLIKTFIGLRLQEVILKSIAAKEGKPWRWASPDEEARNIDGFVGEWSVSIKPKTYNYVTTQDEIVVDLLVRYEKTRSGVVIEYEPPY
jgi:hypothetical protein